MSGIAVLFYRDGRPADGGAVDSMLDAASYRGPDGRRVRASGAVALGLARLVVTPEDETEEQPLVSPRTGCIIVADVRLDNRADLLACLPDQLPASIGDAEIILRSYETWGEAAVERLLGDFAFVLWDPRERRLICARDTSGQRTLYYRADAHTFAAASEIHQLLQDPTIPIAPDDEHIRTFLVPFHMNRPPRDLGTTFYAGIRALQAGCLLRLGDGDLSIRRYWELQPPTELRYRTADDYAEHYRAILEQAVLARLRSAGPVGCTLSGGFDSSSVTCITQELFRSGRATDRGFIAFSNLYEGLECDEREFVDDARAKYGFAAQTIPSVGRATRLQFTATGFRESPLGNTEFDDILSAASRAGIRTLLTGEIADACVGGSPLVFDSLLRKGQFIAMWQRLRRYRRVTDESFRTIAALYCAAPLLPGPLLRRSMVWYRSRSLRLNEHRIVPRWVPEPLSAELYRHHRDLMLDQEGDRRFASPARHYEHHLLYPVKFTRSLAPWSLTLAHPFADRRLHEFLLAVPPEQKFAPHPDTDSFYAGSKQLVRRGLRGVLPESIRTRTVKNVFASVFESEMEREWPLYEATFRPPTASRIAARGYVDPTAFWERLEALRAGAWKNDFVMVMRTVALESWLAGLEQPRDQLIRVAAGGAPSMATSGGVGQRPSGPMVR